MRSGTRRIGQTHRRLRSAALPDGSPVAPGTLTEDASTRLKHVLAACPGLAPVRRHVATFGEMICRPRTAGLETVWVDERIPLLGAFTAQSSFAHKTVR